MAISGFGFGPLPGYRPLSAFGAGALGGVPVDPLAAQGEDTFEFQAQEPGGGIGELLDVWKQAAVNSAAIQITQQRDPIYNPNGTRTNRDCGPTSLAMGLTALGLEPPGEGPQDKINDARFAMFAGVKPGRDGIDEQGRYSALEHRRGSTIADIARGAERYGAEARPVANLDQIREAVENGQPVVVAGNPNAPGGYGHQNGIDFNGHHIILVSGYDAQDKRFIINDPLSHQGPLEVSPCQLAGYLRGAAPQEHPKAVALSRAH